MFDILTLNKIAKCGLDMLGDNFAVSDACDNPDGIILRSFSMHDMELGSNLKGVARAGAGVNNIPIDKCTEKGIVVFNTPGANANAVKELVLLGLLLSSRKVVAGIEWAKTLSGDEVGKAVEKGKGSYVGPEIKGKTLGDAIVIPSVMLRDDKFLDDISVSDVEKELGVRVERIPCDGASSVESIADIVGK